MNVSDGVGNGRFGDYRTAFGQRLLASNMLSSRRMRPSQPARIFITLDRHRDLAMLTSVVSGWHSHVDDRSFGFRRTCYEIPFIALPTIAPGIASNDRYRTGSVGAAHTAASIRQPAFTEDPSFQREGEAHYPYLSERRSVAGRYMGPQTGTDSLGWEVASAKTDHGARSGSRACFTVSV